MERTKSYGARTDLMIAVIADAMALTTAMIPIQFNGDDVSAERGDQNKRSVEGGRKGENKRRAGQLDA